MLLAEGLKALPCPVMPLLDPTADGFQKLQRRCPLTHEWFLAQKLSPGDQLSVDKSNGGNRNSCVGSSGRYTATHRAEPAQINGKPRENSSLAQERYATQVIKAITQLSSRPVDHLHDAAFAEERSAAIASQRVKRPRDDSRQFELKDVVQS